MNSQITQQIHANSSVLRYDIYICILVDSTIVTKSLILKFNLKVKYMFHTKKSLI